MSKTLRGKLLLWFSAFTMLTITVVIIFNNTYFNHKERVTNVVYDINQLNSRMLKNIIHVDNFINLESINPDYHLSGTSELFNQQQRNSEELKFHLENLYSQPVVNDLGIKEEIDKLRFSLEKYELLLQQLNELLLERGYKDYGLVGKMRDRAHSLEEIMEMDKAVVLSLRRHEKDYIIRNDMQYVDLLNDLSNKTKNKIAISLDIPADKKDSIISLLTDYTNYFNQVVYLDKRIGVRSGLGLASAIDDYEVEITEAFQHTISMAGQNRNQLFMKLEVYYFLYFVFLFIFSIFLSLFISKRVTNPLSGLTGYIQNFVRSGFKTTPELSLKHSHSEIEVLYAEFVNLKENIQKRERERDQAENALKKNEQKYRQLADLLPQCVFETNEVGNLRYVNKNWISTFGYSFQDIDEKLNLVDIIISDNKNLVIDGKEISSNEFKARRKDGSIFPALVYSSPIFEDDTIKGYRGIIIDNTERNKYIHALQKEKKKAEDADKLKSAFLANMSHEIRTPMNAIIGFTELIARTNVSNSERLEYIKHIQNSGDLLLNLIDDIIDIAKIEAGELKIVEKDCDINDMLNELFRTFSQILKRTNKKSLELKLHKHFGDKNFVIKTDPFRLKQVLTNLLSNAIKFTEEGFVEFGYTFSGGNIIKFYVNDTGIGISQENQEFVFERFRQLEDPNVRKYGGTGLGLAITKNIVDLLKGQISLESEPASGTRVSVSIPYSDSVLKIDSNETSITNREINWADKTVLIAEDDDSNYVFLKSVLKETKIKISRVKNGKEAVEIIEKMPDIDLILMDVQMPVMNGYEATSLIRKKNIHIPVIAQTAYAMSGEKEKSKLAGCDDYISKPIDINNIIRKMSVLLGKATSEIVT